MKTIRLLLAGFVLSLAARADELKPLPSEIALRNNAKIRGVDSVVRWGTDRVVVKHAGVTDTVMFAAMTAESRAIWEARSRLALPEQQKLEGMQSAAGADARTLEQKAATDAEAWRKRVTNAIATKQLLVGMTQAEAAQSWGEPGNKNVTGGSSGSHEQWVYYEQSATPSRRPRTYVYFNDGRLSSWTRTD